jgi:hypothetical protein
MSEENIKPREHKENIALSKAASEKINFWFEQINSKKKVKLSKKAFVSWYIESAADNLTNGEINSIIERFYDPETHLRQMLREVRKAKKSGQNAISMELILKEKRTEQKKTFISSELESIEKASDDKDML